MRFITNCLGRVGKGNFLSFILTFALSGMMLPGISFRALAQTTDKPQGITIPAEFLPKVDGSLKTKWEINTESGLMRFEVRNARFGVRGNVNQYVGYRAEMDLSDEGKILMLDAYVKLMPVKGLDLYLGQRKVPFSTDYMRSPVENLFANRSFVAKYVNKGLRDIGFVGNYRFGKAHPAEIWIGALNGTGNNNPQWVSRPNLALRSSVVVVPKWRLAANLYQGNNDLEADLLMLGGELRYETEKMLIETEIVQRNFHDTSDVFKRQSGFYIHGMYSIPVQGKMFKSINPVARWDAMGVKPLETNTANRLTYGVNFCMEPKPFKAEIRLNYEDYLVETPTMFDKFTVEFIAKF